MVCSQVVDKGYSLQIQRVGANVLNKPSQSTVGGPSAWVFNGRLTIPPHKELACYRRLHGVLDSGSCEHGNEHSGSIKDKNISWLAE